MSDKTRSNHLLSYPVITEKNCAYFSAVLGILLLSVFFFLLNHQLDHLKNALLRVFRERSQLL